jgi:hypothetical protein
LNSDKSARFIPLMMLALLAWGAMLALGTFLYRIQQAGADGDGGQRALFRGLIVLACTLAFLGLWLAALALRKRRTSPDKPPTGGNEACRPESAIPRSSGRG